MAKNVLKLLFAIISIAWIVGIVIVPNPAFCIGYCDSLGTEDFLPFIIYKGFILTAVPLIYLSWYISREFKTKQTRYWVINATVIYLILLIATSILHKEEFFDCNYRGRSCEPGL